MHQLQAGGVGAPGSWWGWAHRGKTLMEHFLHNTLVLLLVFLGIEIRKIDLTTYNIKMFVESQENC